MGYQRRMFEGSVHHVMNRGAARQPIFADDADRVEFGRLLGEVHERFGVETWAYCLMGNHYHLLVRCTEARLSQAMQHLSSVYTRHANERAGRDGPIFRSRFRSLIVDSDDYLLTAVRYIHRNPLGIVGIDSVDQYRWSSHRAYLGHRRAPSFLVTEPVLRHFGNDVQAFHRFVNTDASQRSDDIDPVFVRQLSWLAVAQLDLGDDERVAGALERTVLILLADRLGVATLRRVFDELGAPNEAARRNALSRARRRFRTSHHVGEALAFALDEFASGRIAS